MKLQAPRAPGCACERHATGHVPKRAVALYKAGGVGPLQRALRLGGRAGAALEGVDSRGGSFNYDANADRPLPASSRAELLDIEAVAAARALVEPRPRRASATHRVAAIFDERACRETRAARCRVREDRSRERALLVELERAARALEETLEGLGDDAGRPLEHGLDGGGLCAAASGSLSRARCPAVIQQRFGRDGGRPTTRPRPFSKRHRARRPRAGDSVRAVARGQVRFAGWFRGYGKIVIVDHGDGYFTVSGHLADIYVEVGRRGRRWATRSAPWGRPARSAGPSLYFEVRQGGSPLDPANWLAKG